MNSGPNQPSSGNNGGRGRRRRRGRRAQGAQSQPQPQNGQQQNGPQQRSSSQGRRHSQQQGKRPHRPSVNQKVPDAGIYSAPMDHSYRTLQGGNGNGRSGGRYRSGDLEAVSSATASTKPIYAFVDDLFFMAKIQETARKLNVKVDFVKYDKDVIESIVSGEEKPSLIIFDLNNLNAKPLTIIPKLKAKLKKETNIIGFLNHLQGDLKAKATEAGCDMVVPRSAFSQNLPQLLRRHATQSEHEAEV